MKKLTLAVLFLTSCASSPKTVPTPVCLQPKELATVVKESCGVHVQFTAAVDQNKAGVLVCVLDPPADAMLCMTPAEAAERGERGSSPEIRRDP
jgi:hypothetical protein